MELFSPRDARAAERALLVLLSVAAVVLAVYTGLAPPHGAQLGLVCCVIIALVGAAVALSFARGRAPVWLFGVTPVAGVVLLAALDMVTRDASAAAQVFFLLPVLFAGAHLRPAAAWLMTVVAMAGEGLTTLRLLPLTEALTDTCYLTAVATTMTVLLVRANRRTDDLLAELRHLAAIDPLTGLVTRRVLDDAASCALTGADTAAGTSFVLLDVDRFKNVNDDFGHPVGDAVLVHVADTLRAAAGPNAVVSRIGGDELAVLLPGTPVDVAPQRAEATAARVRAEPLLLDDGTLVAVTLSMGVAHAPVHAVDLPGLYRAADAALYEAKRAGRDQVVVAGTGPAAGGTPADALPAQRPAESDDPAGATASSGTGCPTG